MKKMFYISMVTGACVATYIIANNKVRRQAQKLIDAMLDEASDIA